MKPVLSLLLACSLLVPVAHAADEAGAASSVATASAPAALPGKDAVKQAIAVLEKDFLGVEASAAANTVMQFANDSKDVSFQISAKTTPWLFGDAKSGGAEDDVYRQMLLVAYLAGNTRAQLAAGKAVDSPLAGWEFALKTYATLQQANAKLKLAELETLKAQQAKGQLPAMAKKALQK